MKKLNYWEQALGLTIETIRPEHTLSIYLNDSESVLQLETDREAFITVVDSTAEPQMYLEMDYTKLYGLKIRKIVVPFLDEGYSGDPTITLGFDDAPDVWLVPEDLTSHIRIT